MKQKTTGRSLWSWILSFAFVLSLLPATASAENVKQDVRSNRGEQDYTTNPFPQSSFLYANPSGGLTLVEKVAMTDWDTLKSESMLLVEDYSSSFQLLSSQYISLEMDRWGTFYAGKDYNFIIVGQDNPNEDANTEVIRVIKYDKNWKRLGAASLRGVNTTVPFDGGTVRCDEYNGYLFVHTCHEMCKAFDGNNHQANMTFSVKISDMSLVDSFYGIASSAVGYNSHSFDQHILVDTEGKVVTLDLGDSSPRGVAFMRYNADAAEGKCTGSGISAALAEFAGQDGYNTTGGSIGGLAETRTGYVAAYNYDGGHSSNTEPRDVYLAYISKSGEKSAPVKLDSTSTGNTTPLLLSTGLDGGYILWNGKNGFNSVSPNDTLYYAQYSANGEVGAVKTAKGYLSNCQPVYYNGRFVWFSSNLNTITFYTFDGSSVTSTSNNPAVDSDSPEIGDILGGTPGCSHNFSSSWKWYWSGSTPGTVACTEDSYSYYTCTICGAKQVNGVTLASGHKYQNGVCTVCGERDPDAPAPQVTPEPSYTPASPVITVPETPAEPTAPAVPTTPAVPAAPATPTTPTTPAPTTTPVTPSASQTNPFTDVPNGAYYHDAVLWAVEKGISNGVTPTQFQPNATCTRGQVVTFLWRAKGSPEPKTKTNPFTDVLPSSAYYKAILWAYENNITAGTTAKTFDPNGLCTSGHVVTFLWRANGQPAANGTSTLASVYAGKYYANAAAWADGKGLLTKTEKTFTPNAASPRADIVTYLYYDIG